MLTARDRVTQLILLSGTFGSVALSLWLCTEIMEFMLVGVSYSFFTANVQFSQRYNDLLAKDNRASDQMRYVKMGKNGAVIALFFTGVLLGILLHTFKTIFLVIFT